MRASAPTHRRRDQGHAFARTTADAHGTRRRAIGRSPTARPTATSRSAKPGGLRATRPFARPQKPSSSWPSPRQIAAGLEQACAPSAATRAGRYLPASSRSPSPRHEPICTLGPTANGGVERDSQVMELSTHEQPRSIKTAARAVARERKRAVRRRPRRWREPLPTAVTRGSLDDGLRICLRLLEHDPERFEAAAVAWHRRWCAELPGIGFAESQSALSRSQH